MKVHLDCLSSRAVLRVALAGLGLALLAGCSSESARFGDPLGNPFTNSARVSDAGEQAARSAPVGKVMSQPLGAPKPYASFSAPAQPSPQLAAHGPMRPAPETTGSIARPAQIGGDASHWSAQGGTPIVAREGETLATLSSRYGVPQDAFLKVNGLSSAAQVQAGTRLIVPIYSLAPAAPRAAEGVTPSKRDAAHEPKMALVKGPAAKIAQDKPQPASARGRKPRVEHAANEEPVAPKTAKTAKRETVKTEPAKIAKNEAAKPAKVEPVKVAKAEPTAKKVDTTTTASLPPAAAAPAVASDSPEFRWPARGRIIQGFKAGGNDGINIAVPEGTSVKAAEGGVVAYAGSELKGYGNLVLIRHPNGFTSAYANNGELDVKRGDTVKRGQTIAKSGQSGNVPSPQLHFELRRGSTPVDPTSYLAGL